MRRFNLTNELINNSQLISASDFSYVFKMTNGNYLKLFSDKSLLAYKEIKVNLEDKLNSANKLGITNDIVKPCAVAYFRGEAVGYEISPANGINFNQYDDTLTLQDRLDLYAYADVHKKIEDIVRTNKNIVVPDLCSCDNIYIDQNHNITLIDYDGMQIGPYRSFMISSLLGVQRDIVENPKYFNKETGLYSKTLDIRSSIILYFITALNVNLTSVGVTAPGEKEPITLDFIFNTINLDDPDICHNVWKMFQKDQKEEFLENTVYEIAEKYNLTVAGMYNGILRKQLIKK